LDSLEGTKLHFQVSLLQLASIIYLAFTVCQDHSVITTVWLDSFTGRPFPFDSNLHIILTFPIHVIHNPLPLASGEYQFVISGHLEPEHLADLEITVCMILSVRLHVLPFLQARR
jgi:hypothetical protein